MEPWGPAQDPALRRLVESNARLQEAARMLEATRREVEASGAEASRLHAATMRAFEALIARLKGDA
jgi:hypothetical protein